MESEQTILIIEDDREITGTIQRVLEAVGYRVCTAENGIEGRQKIDELKPDLVITDMMMPRMGGFPILDYLATLADPPRVIMITANEGSRHKAYAELRGVDDYLRKPFAMDVLLESVERALARKQAADDPPAEPEVKRPVRKRTRRTTKKSSS